MKISSTLVHIRGDEAERGADHRRDKEMTYSSHFISAGAGTISAQLGRIINIIGSGDVQEYFYCSRPAFIHSIKVGVTMVSVSLLYLVHPLYDKIEPRAMMQWPTFITAVAIMFKFYAGATISNCFNYGMGTIMGGGLGCAAAFLAHQLDGTPKLVTVGIFVFFIGSLATYAGSTIPKIKQRYDNGAMIFCLTFNLIAVSTVRNEKLIFKLFIDRLVFISTAIILCILMSSLIFPIWASDKLHGALVDKFDCLAHSIEECLEEFFKPTTHETSTSSKTSSKPSDCLSVLYSKAEDESLVSLARWETWHRKFGFINPWNKYLHIAKLLRELAASVFTLKGFLNSHAQLEQRSPLSSRMAFKEPCEALGTLLSSTLTELGNSIFNMRRFRTKESVTNKLHSTRLTLRLTLSKYQKVVMKVDDNGNDPDNIGGGLLLVSSLISLIDIADKVEALVKEIEELGNVACFQPPQSILKTAERMI